MQPSDQLDRGNQPNNQGNTHVDLLYYLHSQGHCASQNYIFLRVPELSFNLYYYGDKDILVDRVNRITNHYCNLARDFEEQSISQLYQ